MQTAVIVILAALLSACAGQPHKFAWFKLDKGQWDVLWLLSPEGKLLRCTGRDEKPECKQAEAVPAQSQTTMPAPPPPVERKSLPPGTGLLE